MPRVPKMPPAAIDGAHDAARDLVGADAGCVLAAPGTLSGSGSRGPAAMDWVMLVHCVKIIFAFARLARSALVEIPSSLARVFGGSASQSCRCSAFASRTARASSAMAVTSSALISVAQPSKLDVDQVGRRLGLTQQRPDCYFCELRKFQTGPPQSTLNFCFKLGRRPPTARRRAGCFLHAVLRVLLVVPEATQKLSPLQQTVSYYLFICAL